MKINKTMARRVNSPAYIFSEEAFAERAAKVKEALGEKTGLTFSIKANPFLLACLPETFDRVEVCSPGELVICERLGIDMKKVLFSGVNKTPESIARAIADGVDILTAESPLHVEMIEKEAANAGFRVKVLLRLTGGSQFGMDRMDLEKILQDRADYTHIDFIGIHYFTGTQKKKPKQVIKELDFLMELLDQLAESTGFITREVEYGTGLAADYFSGSEEEAEAAEMERLYGIADSVRKLGDKVGLTVEMGRFFAAPAGVYIAEVMDTKVNMGVNYAILDGGIHQVKYDGQLAGMQVPIIEKITANAGKSYVEAVLEKAYAANPVTAPAEDPSSPWCLCGSLCSTADVIVREAPLGDLAIGDRLAFYRTGAYSVCEGISLLLSRDLPSVYLLRKDGKLQMQRDRIETVGLNLDQSCGILSADIYGDLRAGTKAEGPVCTKAERPAGTKAVRPVCTKADHSGGTKAVRPGGTKADRPTGIHGDFPMQHEKRGEA